MASMGPKLISLGNPSDGDAILGLPRLQWGPSLSAWEIETTPNEARPAECCFNGAQAYQLGKSALVRRLCKLSCQLQWGPSLSAWEMVTGTQAGRTSPRFNGAQAYQLGKYISNRIRSRTMACFNGAQAYQLGKSR